MKKINWFFTEIMKMYSSRDKSFFSKKRIESGVAFVIGQIGMIIYLYFSLNKITMGEFLLWATAEFTVSGYIINKIQKEKSTNTEHTDETENPQ